MRKAIMCVAAVTLVVSATVAGVRSPRAAQANPSAPQASPASVEAPNFILQDLSGKARSLKDYRGKVVYLYFTTTWCPYCKKDIPNLKRLHASLKGRPFEIVAVYVNESVSKVRWFAQKYELPYTVLVDDDAQVARLYGVQGVPLRIVLDASGGVDCYRCASAEDSITRLLKKAR
ncbi:MAG TPA: TlpA family protein disulfide reductase [Deltaproteobacteria bacterium]|nr:TlpA family protein disulfide reductase [Deltaproteobacteria bacterium]